MPEPTVTVLCLAYNHAPWIRETLEGFLSQRTRFPVEVLVHDDASTDGTGGIIREYAARYPDRIRAVFQTENQVSRSVPIAPTFLFPLIRGAYVALCEGDDLWTDPEKLQRQVDAMERHPEVDLCAHRAEWWLCGAPHGSIGPQKKDGIIPVEKVIFRGGGFVATSSLLLRRECYLDLTPMRKRLLMDYTLQIQGSLRGGMLYLDRTMSRYREGAPGSWSGSGKGWNDSLYRSLIEMLDLLDTYTGGRYRRVIRLRQWRYRRHLLKKG